MSPDTTSVPDHSARSLGRKPMSLQLKIGLLLTLTIVPGTLSRLSLDSCLRVQPIGLEQTSLVEMF